MTNIVHFQAALAAATWQWNFRKWPGAGSNSDKPIGAKAAIIPTNNEFFDAMRTRKKK